MAEYGFLNNINGIGDKRYEALKRHFEEELGEGFTEKALKEHVRKGGLTSNEAKEALGTRTINIMHGQHAPNNSFAKLEQRRMRAEEAAARAAAEEAKAAEREARAEEEEARIKDQERKETERDNRQDEAQKRQEINAEERAADAEEDESKWQKAKKKVGRAWDKTATPRAYAGVGLGAFGAAGKGLYKLSRSELTFFVFAMGVMIFDLVNEFNLPLGVRLTMYLVLFLLAVWTYRTGTSAGTFVFFGISAASVVIGEMFTSYTILNSMPMIRYVIFFAPLWMVYFVMTDHESIIINVISRLYLAAWIFLFVIWMFGGGASAYMTVASDPQSAFDTAGVWTSFKTFVGDTFKRAKASWIGLKRTLNETTNQIYGVGVVEDNQYEPLGVYLENLRPIDHVHFENNSISVIADMKAKTFIGSITINNDCYAENVNSEKKFEGSVYPPKIEDVTEFAYEILECEIPHTEKTPLLAGTYRVRFTSTFEFETWSYITYTFMNKNLLRSLRAEGKDVNSEYNIELTPIPIYTNGPMQIKMAPISQPIGIDPEIPEGDDKLKLPTPIAIELANNWPGQARVLSIEELKVITPSSLELYDCTKIKPKPEQEGQTTKPAGPDPKEEELAGTRYKTYTYKPFEIEYSEDYEYNYYYNQDLKIVICRIKIQDLQDLIGINPIKTEKTFAVRTKYTTELYNQIDLNVVRPGQRWG
jgi:hypothetical protein